MVADTLSGDGNSAAVTLRLESYQSRCDAVVRSFAVLDGAGEGEGAGKGEGDGVYHQWDPSGDARATQPGAGGGYDEMRSFLDVWSQSMTCLQLARIADFRLCRRVFPACVSWPT